MNILNYLCFCHCFCKMKWLVSRLDMICIKVDYHEASMGNFGEIFCVQRTTEEQPHFLQVLKDIFKHFRTLIIVLA